MRLQCKKFCVKIEKYVNMFLALWKLLLFLRLKSFLTWMEKINIPFLAIATTGEWIGIGMGMSNRPASFYCICFCSV